MILKVKRDGAGISAAREAMVGDLDSKKNSRGVADSRSDRRLDIMRTKAGP